MTGRLPPPDTATCTPELLVQDGAGVRTLVLNRPRVLNAFSRQMYRRVADELESAQGDATVSVVTVTGSGRAFSSGVDLRELGTQTPGGQDARRRDFERFIDVMSTFSKPLLCAVNGLAVGVGATMLGLVDLVLMSDTARVSLPFAARTLLPEAGSTFTLPATMGPQNTAWAMLSGSWLSADECLAAGLAWRVHPGDRLLHEAQTCAELIAQHPVETLVEIKSLLLASRTPLLIQARERESQALARLLAAHGGGPSR
jgi:enoyl-CoA hydratase/carnithine racemase